MGYRSQVYLKTTTEGWVVIKQYNDSIENKEHRPLEYADVGKTASGFYKITFDDIKWYEGSFKEVDNFMHAIGMLDDLDLPYSYIRLGEDISDVEHRNNWTDDMPDEIANFEPVVDVNDEDWSSYDTVIKDGIDVDTGVVESEILPED